MPEYKSLNDLLEIAKAKKQAPFILVLDGIEDPHNFGAILRSAEAADVHGVVIRKNRQVQLNETVIRVSTGAAKLVPIARVANIAESIARLKEAGLVAIGLEISGTKLYNQLDAENPVALVIGSEGAGLSRLVKERCDEIVSIPMKGKINSLNASVAAGIILFEVIRQRG
ncbi:MAG: 23S rRNA (guanosine(2251)-2'-O)-methyltransferase RlmB [bacterium]